MGLAEWAIRLARLQHPDLYDIHVDSVEFDGPEITVAVSGRVPIQMVEIDIVAVPIEEEQ